MSFGAYFSSVYTLLGLAGLAVTCLFAWWKGGPPERLGSMMLAISWFGADIARGFSNQMVPTATLLASDILISGGFLYIAIRYSSLWLGAAMMFQAIGFALHAAQMSDSDAPRWRSADLASDSAFSRTSRRRRKMVAIVPPVSDSSTR
jgi:hypothetical protein